MSRPHEAGVTLVELLVAAAITALIVPVITGALVVGWRTTDDTVGRLSANQDRLLVPSLFTRDVQAAETVETGGAGCLVPGDTLVVRFTWTETDPAGTSSVRTAAWVRTGGATPLLERRYCASGAALTSSVTASRDAASTVVVCRSSAGGPPGGCAGSPMVVELTVTDSSGAAYTATGRRRLS